MIFVNEKAKSELETAWLYTLNGKEKGLSQAFKAEGYSVLHGAVVNMKGASFYEAAIYLYPSNVLACVLEPDNKHDAGAIKIVNEDGETVGHLAKDSDHREKARSVLEDGGKVYALVMSNTLDEPHGTVKLFLVKAD